MVNDDVYKLSFTLTATKVIEEKVINGMTIRINDKDEKILVSRKDGKLIVKKLYTYHLDRNGEKVRFEMKQESDGFKHFIDIFLLSWN